MKNKRALKKTDDPRTYKLLKKLKDLSCSFCRPHQNENAGRKAKHGAKKPKKKDKRK